VDQAEILVYHIWVVDLARLKNGSWFLWWFPDKEGLAHATGVHERNTMPYARFALKKRHGFCAKAREKNMKCS